MRAFVRMVMIAAMATSAVPGGRAQSAGSKSQGKEKADASVKEGNDARTTLRAAAEALGMLRYSDIGAGDVHLPAIDVVNTMEIWGTATVSQGGGTPGQAVYHAALSYNPAAMRVELRDGDAPAQNNGARDTIEVVSGNYAWDESEIGGGLIPGKGTATPQPAMVKRRMLDLCVLPYGAVKAALAAGDKAKVSTENGATVIRFPLSGELAGVSVSITLNPRNQVAKVETQNESGASAGMALEVEYSDYKDHGEILTDILSPGHIVEKQDGHAVMDIRVTKVDANNPYLVFPVPANVKKAAR